MHLALSTFGDQVTLEYVSLVKEWIEIVYHPLQLEIIKDPFNINDVKYRINDEIKQYNANKILDNLERLKKTNNKCFSMLAITNLDIYPKESFNFV